jgi:hypothetical protein
LNKEEGRGLREGSFVLGKIGEEERGRNSEREREGGN